MQVLSLYNATKDGQKIDENVSLQGWIKTNRNNGTIGFIEINDGSCYKSCQVVYEKSKLENFDEITKYLTGCSVRITGKYVSTPDAKQPFEIHLEELELLGACEEDYPLQKKQHSLEFLRGIQHIRPRANTFSAVFRIRSLLCFAIHEFLQKNGFVYITPPIITGNDAEGAGETFTVTTREDNQYEEDFFEKNGLKDDSLQSKSIQMLKWNKEALIKSFSNVGFEVKITVLEQSEERLITEKDISSWFDREKSMWGASIASSLGENDFSEARSLFENHAKKGPITWKWKSLLMKAQRNNTEIEPLPKLG